MSALDLSDLVFGNVGPLRLHLDAGECLVLTGSSGAGKTRLLRAIADLDPHDGEAFVRGISRRTMSGPEWRRRVALLAAAPAWWHGDVGAHFDRSGESWVRTLGFDSSVLEWPVTRLSAGESQRLALARVLAGEPDVLLLDEPTSHLDDVNARRVEGLLSDYRREAGAAVVWVSHDRQQAQRVGSRCLALENGRLRPA